MEYTKRVGRTTFRADVTYDKRGDWKIQAGAFQATLPMTGPDAEAWLEAGKPTEPSSLPEHIEAFVSRVAAKPSAKREPRKIKYDPRDWAPLDGEERVIVKAVDFRPVPFTDPNRFTTGIVRCTSPRCADTRENGWFVVQLPGSRHDRIDALGTRIEGVTPEQFAEQHREWHRKTNPATTSARVALSQWIDRHRDMQLPELNEEQARENRLALTIAKSER